MDAGGSPAQALVWAANTSARTGCTRTPPISRTVQEQAYEGLRSAFPYGPPLRASVDAMTDDPAGEGFERFVGAIAGLDQMSAAVRSYIKQSFQMPSVGASFGMAPIQQVAQILSPPVSTRWVNAQLGATFRDILPSIDTSAMLKRILPPNLSALETVSFIQLDRLAAQEGITLYSVPRPDIAARLLAAPDATRRRAILGASIEPILDDCEAVLDQCVSSATVGVLPLLRAASRAIRAGHHEAGQALAANVLDTLMQQAFSQANRKRLTWHPRRPEDPARPAEIEELKIRAGLALLPVWWAYRPFNGYGDAPAPTAFSRHATVHGVSGRQFSRRNAVQATMLATGLCAYLNGL